MNVLNKKSKFDNQPHAHLTDGRELAVERIKSAFDTYDLADDVLGRLWKYTFLQSDASGRPIIRHDTGSRIVSTSPVEVEQSFLSGYSMEVNWHLKLLAVPHPVYAPNRPIWLKDGSALFRNTWRQSEVTANVADLHCDGAAIDRPAVWSQFIIRLFGGEIPEIRDQDKIDEIESYQTDHVRFIKEFELWLAFTLYSDQRPKWSPILRGEHGTGKGTLADYVIQPFVGKSNHIKVLPHNIKGDHGAQFLTEKCMVVFDEVNDRGAVFYDRLKNMTTENDLAVNPKNLAPYVDDAVFSTLILSNEEVPMGYPEGERRWLVSPYMVHRVNQTETGDWLFRDFVPWLRTGGYSELGLYLKYLVATEQLPSVAWKSPWFMETCKANRNEDHATAIGTWLDGQDSEYGYTITGISNYFNAPTSVVKQCLTDAGYKRSKTKGTGINVYKQAGKIGTLHPQCSKIEVRSQSKIANDRDF